LHVEIEENNVAKWGQIPAYANALDKALDAGATGLLRKTCDEQILKFSKKIELLYMNRFQTAAYT